jgi:RNA polymerase sigma factor (sigma-70 family)
MADVLAGPAQALHRGRTLRVAQPQTGERRWGPGRTCCAAGGCGGALLDVLIEHRHMLVTLAASFVGCGSRAEDVVHDVFVRLMAFPNQHAIRQPVAYVTRMVRNAAMDVCDRETLESTWHADAKDGLDVASSEPGPEAALATRDELRHAFDALAQLPERTRAAFEFVRLREETLQDTARVLNVSQTLVHFMVRDAAKYCADCVHPGIGQDSSGVARAAGLRRPGSPRIAR